MTTDAERATPGRTMEQLRARHALAVVGRVANGQGDKPTAYRRHARRLGPAILMNGLGQAAATLAASSDARQLYDDLTTWLCRECPGSPYAGKADLIAAIADGSRTHYMWASEEALAWLEWVKKIAVAQLPGGDEP